MGRSGEHGMDAKYTKNITVRNMDLQGRAVPRGGEGEEPGPGGNT